MAKSQAHFRLEESLLQAIKAKAEAEKITVTDLVTKFLKQGLGIDIQEDIQTVNTKNMEEIVYQRVSERIAHELIDLENRISIRISECISELNNNWEKRISQSISTEPKTTAEILENKKEERVSDKEENTNYKKPETTENTISVSDSNTGDTQEELKLFDVTPDEQIMKPGKLVAFIKKEIGANSWDIYKLKSIRMKQITWVKKQNNPEKKVDKESPLPIVIGEYLIDWVISDEESKIAVGKEWWIKKLPKDTLKREEIINVRREKYINHYANKNTTTTK